MLSIHDLNQVKAYLQPAYHRFRSLKGDYLHDPPAHPGTPDGNAPNHILVLVIDALRPDTTDAIPLDTEQAITLRRGHSHQSRVY